MTQEGTSGRADHGIARLLGNKYAWSWTMMAWQCSLRNRMRPWRTLMVARCLPGPAVVLNSDTSRGCRPSIPGVTTVLWISPWASNSTTCGTGRAQNTWQG